jgi:osmoprotectant transport system permease protein
MQLLALSRLGIGGIGIAPAVIALTLYCCRSREHCCRTYGVPRPVIEAATGMGMSRGQIFARRTAACAAGLSSGCA